MTDNPKEPIAGNLKKVGEIVEVIDEGELVEIVEIEVFAKENKKPPRAKRYKFRIDRDHFVVDHRIITGAELFELAKKSPDGWRMHQKLHGGHMKEIKVGDTVDLGEPGIERFVTMELTQGDGEEAAEGATATMEPPVARRHFRLPEEDEAYLDTLDLIWETINSGNVRWLILLDHPLPAGYKQKTATVAIRIEGGYPPGALDMAYFLPHLERADGKAIKSISPVPVDGVSYQQWSRHYSWRDGVDSIATHHLRVKNWLEAEPKR